MTEIIFKTHLAPTEPLTILWNCPIVPDRSTAPTDAYRSAYAASGTHIVRYWIYYYRDWNTTHARIHVYFMGSMFEISKCNQHIPATALALGPQPL